MVKTQTPLHPQTIQKEIQQLQIKIWKQKHPERQRVYDLNYKARHPERYKEIQKKSNHKSYLKRRYVVQ